LQNRNGLFHVIAKHFAKHPAWRWLRTLRARTLVGAGKFVVGS
jgi:hypothetical protein